MMQIDELGVMARLADALQRFNTIQEQIAEDTAKLALGVVKNWPNWTVRRIEVVTAGTPVQGPNVPIPNGVACRIRMPPGQAQAPLGYAGRTPAAVRDPNSRVTLIEDGNPVPVQITNMNMIWVDANTANTFLELIAELEN